MKPRFSIKKCFYAVIAVAFFAFIFLVSAPHIRAQNAALLNGYTVVIDPGHGGVDGGVTGTYTRNKESDINLYISRALRTVLKKRGYRVIMTRNDENGLYDEGAGSKKLSDMNRRREIIEEAAPSLVVSVHQNFYPSPMVSGAQVFYAPSAAESERVASVMQKKLCEVLGGDREHKSADYYILRCSPYPSVLVECAFMSNEREDRLLNTSAYRQKTALAIADGIDASLAENVAKARVPLD